MPFSVTKDDVLSISADAAVICVEISGSVSGVPSSERLAEAGGAALRDSLRRQKFLPVGSAAAAEPCGLPFRSLIRSASPWWMNSRGNEFLILHRCYRSIYAAAKQLGCRRVVMPFLSASYYGFPQEEAVNIALTEAGKTDLETVFAADTQKLYEIGRGEYRKPKIISYVGYYRDHALFELDNGFFARVDLRPEIVEVTEIPYFEACYREGNNPLQKPLPEEEIARLRGIYEAISW